jgi:hypothetical protein
VCGSENAGKDATGPLEPVADIPSDAREATAISPPQQESEHSPPAQNPEQRVKSREAIARAYGLHKYDGADGR